MSYNEKTNITSRACQKIPTVVTTFKQPVVPQPPAWHARFIRRNATSKQICAPNDSQPHQRARYYDAKRLSRFISKDPIGYPDGLNPFAGYFVPMAVDPTGLLTFGCKCDCTAEIPVTGVLRCNATVCERTTITYSVTGETAAEALEECNKKCSANNSDRRRIVGLESTKRCTGSLGSLPISGNEPKFNPDFWNDSLPGWLGGTIFPGMAGENQWGTNCYGYAYDKCKWRHPGGGTSTERADITCAIMKQRAIEDGLKPIGRMETCPTGTSKVALLVHRHKDYHWIRQDENGFWSHKSGACRVTDEDNDDKPIADPEDADFGDFEICGYFCVDR